MRGGGGVCGRLLQGVSVYKCKLCKQQTFGKVALPEEFDHGFILL